MKRTLAIAAVCLASITAATLPRAPALAYQGAPSLSEQSLPAIEARLPTAPEVVKTAAIGRFGGTLRTVIRGDADHNQILRTVGNMGLTRWSPDFQTLLPNVAEGWTANASSSEYIFKLRAGMKWSDGHPFTADDILFFVNDLLPNKEFFASPPSQYVVAGQPMRAERIDDLTVKLIFAGPYLRLPGVLAGPLGQHPVLYAKHYCQQFVPKYNPDIGKTLAASRQQEWPTLLRQRCGDIEIPARWANPQRPVLDPWVITTPYSGGATEVVLKRNPYFWQVDGAGNQLPYIDTVNFKVISDIQSIVLAAIGGKVDFLVRHINTINNKPLLSKHAAEAKYALVPLEPAEAAATGLFFNQTDKDQKLRRLLTNHDFRAALSLGIDRDEINNIVYLGQSRPWQTSPAEVDEFYNRQLATQFVEHDVGRANAMLDKLGLAKKDSNGFRQYPDGSKLFLTADVEAGQPGFIDVLQLIKKDWADIGIDLGINTTERSLFYERAQSNDYDIAIQALTGGLHPSSDPRVWLSTHNLDSRQSLQWVRWYESGGKQGEEPSPSMKLRLKLWDDWKQAATQDQADTLFKRILQLAADEFEVIGIVQGVTTFGIRNAKLMNVPAKIPLGWEYATPAPTLPQQYFFAP